MPSNRPRVYIDGHVGTTGLRIRDWLHGRDDLDLLHLPEGSRKDPDGAPVTGGGGRRGGAVPAGRRGARGGGVGFGERNPGRGREHRAPRGGRVDLRAAGARSRTARTDRRRRARIESRLLSERLRAPRPTPGRCGIARAGHPALGARPVRLFRWRPRAHRAVGVAGGRAGTPPVRGSLRARSGAQAHPGNDPLRGARPRAAVPARGRSVPVRHAGPDPDPGRCSWRATASGCARCLPTGTPASRSSG